MKKLVALVLIAFVIGDCVQLVKGVFAGSYWTVTAVNTDGTYDLKDGKYLLRNVRQSYVGPCRKESKPLKPSDPYDWGNKK